MLLHFLQLFGIPLLFVLLPLGLYCLALATINRRPHPVLVPGSWDAAGTLFAASGLFLVLVPALIDELYYRAAGTVPAEGQRGLFAVWTRFWFVWLAYYVALVAGAALLISWRATKTMIYNVDTDRFPAMFTQSVTRLGYDVASDNDHLVLTHEGKAPPVDPPAGALPSYKTEPPGHEIEIDPFPSGHHVTLHWGRHSRQVREAVEGELRKEFARTITADNLTGGLFLVVSGFIFGFITLVAMLLVMTRLLHHRF